jgi:uncharacterized protein YbjQ (UPF0145 family)
MRIQSVIVVFAFIGCTPATSNVLAPATLNVLAPTPPANRVLVTTQSTCPDDRNCDILAIVDLHTDATSEDKGFDELRGRAAAVGGDAVIGAEFEHGEGGGPSHLSGMVVRYGQPVPPHTVVGEVDIASDEDSTDKGMAALSQRMIEMGGDQVIGVTFEHGEDGKQGHLRGTVIRHTR